MSGRPPTGAELERGRVLLRRVEAMMLAARPHVRGAIIVWHFPPGVIVLTDITIAKKAGLYSANEEGEACIAAMRRACRNADQDDEEPSLPMVRAAWDLAKEAT